MHERFKLVNLRGTDDMGALGTHGRLTETNMWTRFIWHSIWTTGFHNKMGWTTLVNGFSRNFLHSLLVYMNTVTLTIFNFQTHAWHNIQTSAEIWYPIKPAEHLCLLWFNTVQHILQWQLLHSLIEMLFADFWHVTKQTLMNSCYICIRRSKSPCKNTTKKQWCGSASTTLCSKFSWGYPLSITACILNGQWPRCYSQYKYVSFSVAF